MTDPSFLVRRNEELRERLARSSSVITRLQLEIEEHEALYALRSEELDTARAVAAKVAWEAASLRTCVDEQRNTIAEVLQIHQEQADYIVELQAGDGGAEADARVSKMHRRAQESEGRAERAERQLVQAREQLDKTAAEYKAAEERALQSERRAVQLQAERDELYRELKTHREWL